MGIHSIDENLVVSINIDEVRRQGQDGMEDVLAEKTTGLVNYAKTSTC